MNYRLSDAALADLENIHSFGTRRFGMVQADAYVLDLLDFIDEVAAMPLTYGLVSFLAPGVRRAVCKSNSIYYRAGSRIEVLRIIGRQDPSRALDV